ncbi:hypothetical protein LCGC14_0370750 [marine sediment metagenome]|uniref:Uncharacterized protein n=1 Tax=marine sediment metagenome TaxID=412755 RepID=A0A0F9TB55_9ZZZZ|nr:hypothetical protein [Maribacter sp.]HDZ04838.1 hypothetical protein [Maribacter sp.]
MKKAKKLLEVDINFSVYTQYKSLYKDEKGWNKKMTKVIKERMVVTDDYADSINAVFGNSGVFMEINKSEDKIYQDKKDPKKK